MVFLVGKESPFFDREEACRGFEKNKENLDDVNGFERLIKDSRFFNVYDKDGYIGSVFVYQSEADDFFIWVDMLSAKNIANAWTQFDRRRICSLSFMQTQGT